MTLRVICLGLSGRGRHWVQTVQEAKDVELAGVVEPMEERRREIGDQLAVPPDRRFASIAEAIKAAKPDGAIIVTPNVLHEAHIDECLAAGLHVLCEKPLVMNRAAGERVIAHAKRAGRVLQAVQNYRWQTAVLTARQVIADRAVGEPTSCVADFHRLRPIHGMPYPLLYNQSIHHLDTARWLFNTNAAWVMAASWNPSWHDCDGDTMLEATYGMADGVIFHYSGNYTSRGGQTPYSALWRIECSEGSIHFGGDTDFAVRLQRGSQPETVATPVVDPLGSNGRLLQQFAEAVATGKPPVTNAEDNMNSLAMVWGAIESSEKRKRVDVKPYP